MSSALGCAVPPCPHTTRPLSAMFKRFTVADDVSTQTAIKSSAIRAIKSTVEGQYPASAAYMDDVMPKKAVVLEGKGCVGD